LASLFLPCSTQLNHCELDLSASVLQVNHCKPERSASLLQALTFLVRSRTRQTSFFDAPVAHHLQTLLETEVTEQAEAPTSAKPQLNSRASALQESSPAKWLPSLLFGALQDGSSKQGSIGLFQAHQSQQSSMSAGGLCLLLVVSLLAVGLLMLAIAARQSSSDAHGQQAHPNSKGSSTSLMPIPQSRASLASHKVLPSRKSTGELSTWKTPPQPPHALPVGQHLCPELVVPEASECTLLVPWLPQPGTPWAKNSLTIDDARGIPVFRISPGDSDRDHCRLALYSALGEAVFASVRDVKADSGGDIAMLTFHHQSGAIFGEIHPDNMEAGTRYTVVSCRGARIHIYDNKPLGSMNATDEHGRLLAIAEPRTHGANNMVRSLRIGPLVDAGLIVLALLGSDLLARDEHMKSRD